MHVVALPPVTVDRLDAGLYQKMRPAIYKAAEEDLAAFARQHFPAMAPRLIVTAGDPGTEIVAAAGKDRVSLIMMPTHGHGGFRRLLTGSVTAKVLHDSKTPVWTDAHAQAAPRKGRSGKLEVVLCAADQTDEAVRLVRWAAGLAQQSGASLKVVHVMAAVDEASTNRGEKAVRRYWTTQASAGMKAVLKRAGRPKTDLLLRGGDIATMLAATAKEQRASILVIGRGKISRTLGRLRTNGMSIITKSPCPVLSI
jgi:nucleotide-binding universal stress UspA family protein